MARQDDETVTLFHDAVFHKSSTLLSQCPDPVKPEIAFIGRSNVGKSSLINALTNNSKLAKTSGTPGKTQCINHFEINETWYLVDLPGYGYARVSKKSRSKWETMISHYLLKRDSLTCTFILIDSRLELQKIDREFIQWCGENGLPIALVLTKTDKLKRSQLAQNVAQIKKALHEDWEDLPPFFITSSEKRIGLEELAQFIKDNCIVSLR